VVPNKPLVTATGRFRQAALSNCSTAAKKQFISTNAIALTHGGSDEFAIAFLTQ
jgi:hypothetical protein